MTRIRSMILLLPALALAGCDQVDALPIVVSGDPVALVYAPALDVDLSRMIKSPSGLFYRDIVVGRGPVADSGTQVSAQYTGWLANGHKFDSSRDRGEPFEFQVGAGSVIKGWDEGVEGMRVGGRRQLVLPATLAYGATGAGDVVPPGAVLIFDIELIQVR
jgi:FKBP-type peptidyl-prolyl cis-trans isomerase